MFDDEVPEPRAGTIEAAYRREDGGITAAANVANDAFRRRPNGVIERTAAPARDVALECRQIAGPHAAAAQAASFSTIGSTSRRRA